jgi:hypothetical protein
MLAAAVASAALLTSVASNAAPYTAVAGHGIAAQAAADILHNVQYGNRFRGRGYYRPPVYAPRRFYGGPARAWAYRPWYRRPYYGTIIGGIALGTIIGVATYGLAPRPPRPDLCWYWADPVQSSGYWDYC